MYIFTAKKSCLCYDSRLLLVAYFKVSSVGFWYDQYLV